jgi:hypothetical protein
MGGSAGQEQWEVVEEVIEGKGPAALPDDEDATQRGKSQCMLTRITR